MGPEIRKKAKEVYQKLRTTIKEIPRSLQERRQIVVETAVSNDDRPESCLAAHDTTRILHDKQGVPYGEKGAESSFSLLHAVGPPLEAIGMPIPEACPSNSFFKWAVIDDCWTLPKPGLACVPLSRNAFKNKAPWEVASRALNKTRRHGGGQIRYQRGGWVDAQSALAVVSQEVQKRFGLATARKIATVHWLFALMFDPLEDPTVKSRYQLAGVVDNDGILVQICYIRNKSGHSSKKAKLIPDETIYTKITEEHLGPCTSRAFVIRQSSSTLSIFAIGLVPGGISSTNNRAHTNFTPFPPFDKRNLAPGRLGGSTTSWLSSNPKTCSGITWDCP